MDGQSDAHAHRTAWSLCPQRQCFLEALICTSADSARGRDPSLSSAAVHVTDAPQNARVLPRGRRDSSQFYVQLVICRTYHVIEHIIFSRPLRLLPLALCVLETQGSPSLGAPSAVKPLQNVEGARPAKKASTTTQLRRHIPSGMTSSLTLSYVLPTKSRLL